jgi:tetratricopeptide (TPR) repeat protein
VNRSLMTLAAAIALGLAPMALAAETVRPLRFGTLEGASPAAAKAKAAEWLKESGKTDAATMARFDKIWSEDVSVLDRVVRTFELGDPAAAKLLADARDPGALAPTQIPDLLKNAKDPFFKANFALGYGRALSARSVHDEAIEAFKQTVPEQVVDPASYLFHRALSEHALLEKAAAIKTIDRLLDDVGAAPERYRTVAVLMLVDMHNWSEKDLDSIARKMKNVERRLEISRGGPKTQKIQKEIVARLDEMIKELENKSKGSGSGSGNGGNCPGGAPGDGPPQGGSNPTSPASDSYNSQNGGPGYVEQAKLKKLVEKWGSLPPLEQARAMQELTQGMSRVHREAIENYFRNLAAAQSKARP